MRRTIVVAVIAVVVLAGCGDGHEPAQPQQSAPRPTSTPTTTAKPEPVSLRQTIGNALHSSNRGKDPRPSQFDAPKGQTIILTWAIDENLTDSLTKRTARIETVAILKAIRSHPDWKAKRYPGVTVKGTYSMQNAYGEVSELVVVRAHFSRATINRIRFENIDSGAIFDLAGPVSIHPAFQ
jgi:hypothetical protein